MAAITAAALTVGSAAYQANRAGAAAKAQQAGMNQGIGTLNDQFARTEGNLQPYMQAGTESLSRLQAVNNGEYTDFWKSPDYLGALEQGTEAQNRAAAAVGNVSSGGTSADLMRFGQQLASQNLGNYRNSLMGIANLGQNSAVNLGQFGAQNAQAVSGLQAGIGQARAAGIAQKGQIWGDAMTSLAGMAGGMGGGGGGGGMGGFASGFGGGMFKGLGG